MFLSSKTHLDLVPNHLWPPKAFETPRTPTYLLLLYLRPRPNKRPHGITCPCSFSITVWAALDTLWNSHVSLTYTSEP